MWIIVWNLCTLLSYFLHGSWSNTTDSQWLNGFVFSFSINPLVGSCSRLNWLPVGFWLHVKHLHSDSDFDSPAGVWANRYNEYSQCQCNQNTVEKGKRIILNRWIAWVLGMMVQRCVVDLGVVDNSSWVVCCTDNVTAPPLSVKIENRSDSPSFTRAAGDTDHHLSTCHGDECLPYGSSSKLLASTQSLRASNKVSGIIRRPDDSCCSAAKPVKSQCASPRHAGVGKRRSRSRSRSPSASHPARSRSHHSRHSVDIKMECTTPTMHKKSSRYCLLCLRPCREGGIIKWAALSVCLSVCPSVHLSRAST